MLGESTIGANSCNGGTSTCLFTGFKGESVTGENSCNSDGIETCKDNRNNSNSKKAIIGNKAYNASGACK